MKEKVLVPEDYLYNKAKLTMINDKVDSYRNGNVNIYTVMRDIINIVKEW